MMTIILRRQALAALVTVISLGGCASSGREIDEAKVGRFVVGRTTEPEVIAALGQPNSSTFMGGFHSISYVYVHIQTRAATFIPVVGMFAGGADSTTQSATFTFDANGLLSSGGHSNTNVGTSTGPL
jgi:hypothetical protein